MQNKLKIQEAINKIHLPRLFSESSVTRTAGIKAGKIWESSLNPCAVTKQDRGHEGGSPFLWRDLQTILSILVSIENIYMAFKFQCAMVVENI